MIVKLVVVQGKPQGKEIPLRAPKFLIGRGTECHLRPNSELISRHHCLFVVNGPSVTLRDLGSTNGTLVNGERISGEVPVFHEDLIHVGPLGFRMVVEAVPAVAIPDPAPNVVAPPVQASVKAGASVLGAADLNDDDLPKWLKSDHRPALPGTASDGSGGDSDLSNTHAESAAGQDTQHELPVVHPPTDCRIHA